LYSAAAALLRGETPFEFDEFGFGDSEEDGIANLMSEPSAFFDRAV
jgi:hypothetical protein